jgi:hypothetical protein
MDPVKIELLVEFAVVLAAPPLYQYYLWRKGRTTPPQLWLAVRLFAPLYGRVLVALSLLLTKA